MGNTALETPLPPFIAIPDSIRRAAQRTPEKAAVIFNHQVTRWRDFDRDVDRTAHYLAGLGIRKGDKVAILGLNSPLYLTAFMGVLRAGAVAVPLSTMTATDALERMIVDADTKAIFLAKGFYANIAAIEPCLDGLLEGGEIALDFRAPGWIPYRAALNAAPSDPFLMDIAADDEFNIIYSSGTTGLPKGIIHVHSMRSALPVRFAAFDFNDTTVSIVSTPIYGNFTLAGMLPALAHGGTVILMEKFREAEYLALCEHYRVTHAMLVPVQYQRLLALKEFGATDLSAFRTKFTAGSPMDAGLKKEILDRWPGRLVELYGLTEGGPGTVLDASAHPDKLHTVGKAGLSVDLRILDADNNSLKAGEVGEVVGRSPLMMMKGYHKQPDKTEELVWKDENGDVFYRSGDYGKLDEDGFLILLDRKKDMIISGGFNIYAADIEAVLYQHPAVQEVAVIGIPSKWGESPLAIIVKKPGADVDEDGLMAWANERLSKTARLHAVEFRSELPRSTLGKIMKRELRAPYWAKKS